MKKIFQYSFAALAGLVLASCNGDYEDWLKPQGYDQENPAAAYGVTATPASITMPVSDDDVTLFTFAAASEEVKGYALRKLLVDGAEVNYNVVGNNVVVSANEIETVAVDAAESRAQKTHTLDVDVDFGAILNNGDAVAGKLDVNPTITTSPTPAIDAKGYFLLGNFAENGNGWDLAAPVWMTDNGDGTYSAIVNTTGDGDNWFKFYEGSHYSADSWDEVNAGQMGCSENGCPDKFGFIIWTGDKTSVETPVIQGKGQFKVTIDMVNFTYKVVRQAVNYYIVGGPNDWGESAKQKTLKFNQADIEVPVYTIVFPAAAEGDTWFAIGDDKACDAIANDNEWKLLFGTTSGNGEQGENGTLARRTELKDDGSFKVPAGAKFISVTLDMDAMTYQVKTLDFGEYIYEAGVNNNWGDVLQPLYCSDGQGTYKGFFYAEGADWANGKGAFKFRGAADNWDNGNYGAVTMSDDGLTGTLIDDGGSGNILVEPGFYMAVVNLAAMTYSMTPITTIGIIGPGQAGGWDSDTDMTYNPETRAWEATLDLAADEIKFRANDDWGINWGGSVDNLTQDGANLKIDEAGQYFIQFFPLCETKSYCTITKK